MKEELHDLIRDARRELRRASGIPLTAEEQAEEHRTAEIARMERSLQEKLGIRVMFLLIPKVIWTEKGATAQFTVEDHHFQLYKDGKSYRLSETDSGVERELLNLGASDSNFARRVLVAIGDALVKPE